MKADGKSEVSTVKKVPKQCIKDNKIISVSYKKGFKKVLECNAKNMKIGICKSGKGKIIHDKNYYDYDIGKYLILFPDHIFLIQPEADTNWEYIVVEIDKIREILFKDNRMAFDRMLRDSINGALVFGYLDKPEIGLSIRLLLVELSERRPMYTENALVVLLALIVFIIRDYYGVYDSKNSRHQMNGFDFILPSLQYIQDHYSEVIRISDLAKACHVSESYFRTAFSDYMNMVPLEYLNQFRVEKACDLLLETDYSLELISEKVGFRSMATFYRNFKNKMGCTPHEYRCGEI